MIVLLLCAGARVDTNEDLVQQLLTWEKARKVASDVLEQVRQPLNDAVQEETSSVSVFKAADDDDKHSNLDYVRPKSLGGESELQAGQAVPMTPLIAAVSSGPSLSCLSCYNDSSSRGDR